MLAEGQGQSPGPRSSNKKGRSGQRSEEGRSSREQSAARRQVDEIEDDEGIDGIGRVEVDGLEADNYGEEEVSINLEDAIATAEGINAHEISNNLQR